VIIGDKDFVSSHGRPIVFIGAFTGQSRMLSSGRHEPANCSGRTRVMISRHHSKFDHRAEFNQASQQDAR